MNTTKQLPRNETADVLDLATEIWAAAQKAPSEDIANAIDRIAQLLIKDRLARANPYAWATHHDEPMVFFSLKEAEAYCDDDEDPIPLFKGPQPMRIAEDFIDDLAQEIRRVDGGHSLGAGALAEALLPFLSRAMLETEAAPETNARSSRN